MNEHISGYRRVRQPAFAGTFYPGKPDSLRSMVEGFLNDARTRMGQSSPKAIIAPHAGYPYSGPVAGSAFIQFQKDRHQIRRVVLLGPSHRVALAGLAASGADAFATPLGHVLVDHEALALILDLPQVQILDAAHANEHSLEVELPFLQTLLPEAHIVPLLVGEATPEEVSDCLDRLWDGGETRIVVSTDLSHFLDYETARELDRDAARKIEQMQFRDLDSDQACGCAPVRGFLCGARKRGMRGQLIDLRNSGDTAGSRDRVVGYGAFMFTETSGGSPGVC